MATVPYRLPITNQWDADSSIAATEDTAVIMTNTEEDQTVFFLIGPTGTLPILDTHLGHRVSSATGSFPNASVVLKAGESMYIASLKATAEVTVSKGAA